MLSPHVSSSYVFIAHVKLISGDRPATYAIVLGGHSKIFAFQFSVKMSSAILLIDSKM